MELGHLRDQATIGLLRERIKNIVGTEPCLHMANRDLLVERREGCSKGCCRVSLD